MISKHNFLNDHIILVLLGQRGFERSKAHEKEFKRLETIYDRKKVKWFEVCDYLVSIGYMDKKEVKSDSSTSIVYKTNQKGIDALNSRVFESETQSRLESHSQKRIIKIWTVINAAIAIIVGIGGGYISNLIPKAGTQTKADREHELYIKIDSLSRALRVIESKIPKESPKDIITSPQIKTNNTLPIQHNN